MRDKLVSICVSVYNKADNLAQCLDSILNQDYSNLEIIVVDDCSLDNSWEIIQSYASNDKRIKAYKNEQNLGPNLTTQKAYDLSTGYYLGSVDADDYITRDCISSCVKEFANKSIGLVYTYCNLCGDEEGFCNRNRVSYTKERLLSYFMVFHFRLFKKELWNKVRPFSVIKYCWDYDLALKLSEITNFKCIKRPLYYWRKHSNQITKRANQSIRNQEVNQLRLNAKKRRGIP